MIRSLSLTLLLVFAIQPSIYPQDTLPGFSVVVRPGDKVLISWTNRYATVSQISIQRSSDSLRNFTTIVTVPDPSVLQNGFVDAKAKAPLPFYRLFIVLDSGKYVFTPSRRPGPDLPKAAMAPPVADKRPPDIITKEESKPGVPANRPPAREGQGEKEKKPVVKEAPPVVAEKPEPPPEKYYYFKKNDSVTILIRERELKRFRDSIFFRTRDTVLIAGDNTIEVRPFVPKDVFRASRYVFTGRDGNVNIVLPDVTSHHYSIKFFDTDDNTPLFDIRQVKVSPLILDKANFLHAGWFNFELYEDGKVKEKNKILIPKEF